MFELHIRTDNAAFQDHPDGVRAELNALLNRVAQEVALDRLNGSIRDSNGNVVGSYALKELV